MYVHDNCNKSVDKKQIDHESLNVIPFTSYTRRSRAEGRRDQSLKGTASQNYTGWDI